MTLLPLSIEGRWWRHSMHELRAAGGSEHRDGHAGLRLRRLGWEDALREDDLSNSHQLLNSGLTASYALDLARRLHDAAAEKCFIARSVSFKVERKPKS